MDLLEKILNNKNNLKEETWFYPQELSQHFQIYDNIPIDNRLTKKWFESWICTDTQVGIAVYFLDDELVCISWQPYRKSDEEFWFISEKLAKKVYDYLLNLSKKEQLFTLIDKLPNLEEFSKKIDYKKFEFSAEKVNN